MLDGRDSKYSSTSESAINVAQRSQLLQEVWFGTFICVNLHVGQEWGFPISVQLKAHLFCLEASENLEYRGLEVAKVS